MRKSDKKHKPQFEKVVNKITIKQSKEELNKAKDTLEIAKQIPRKVFFAPKGFSHNKGY